jgi:hypothetical protein
MENKNEREDPNCLYIIRAKAGIYITRAKAQALQEI